MQSFFCVLHSFSLFIIDKIRRIQLYNINNTLRAAHKRGKTRLYRTTQKDRFSLKTVKKRNVITFLWIDNKMEQLSG